MLEVEILIVTVLAMNHPLNGKSGEGAWLGE